MICTALLQTPTNSVSRKTESRLERDRDSGIRILSLGELEPLARLRTARLLPLNFAGVAREQILRSQPNSEAFVRLQQCSGEAETNGFSLPRQSTTGDSNEDVVLPLRLGEDERASYRLL